MKKKQLFFDLDRTLWDFETNSRCALEVLYRQLELGTRIEHFEHFHHTYVRINADMWLRYGKGKITKEELRNGRFLKALAYHGIHSESLAKQLADGYINISPRQTVLFPQVVETLQLLQKEGYRMHIITNGFREVQFLKLDGCGLTPFFDRVLCSEEAGVNKPDRKVFRMAEEWTDCLPEDAVMIGDDMKADIHGALQAGWHAIHFDPGKKLRSDGTVPRIRSINELPLTLAMHKLN